MKRLIFLFTLLIFVLTAYWTFDVGLRPAYYYAFAIAIDSVKAGNPRTAVTVWGSMDNVNFVSSGITQVNVWPTAGLGPDTTLVMANVTTAQIWRYLKVRFITSNTAAIGPRVKAIGLKVGNK
jgi:hypothetical protein